MNPKLIAALLKLTEFFPDESVSFSFGIEKQVNGTHVSFAVQDAKGNRDQSSKLMVADAPKPQQ